MNPAGLAGAQRLFISAALLCCSISGSAQTALSPIAQPAGMALRKQEIAQCLPGEISTWADGNDRAALAPSLTFTYDNSAAPLRFDRSVVMGALQKAAAAWSECGVPARVVPEADADIVIVASVRVSARRWRCVTNDGEVRLVWTDQEGRLLRLSIPARNLEALRDDVPR